MLRTLLFHGLGSILCCAPAFAQCGGESWAELHAPGAASDEFFGETVRGDGVRLVVGA